MCLSCLNTPSPLAKCWILLLQRIEHILLYAIPQTQKFLKGCGSVVMKIQPPDFSNWGFNMWWTMLKQVGLPSSHSCRVRPGPTYASPTLTICRTSHIDVFRRSTVSLIYNGCQYFRLRVRYHMNPPSLALPTSASWTPPPRPMLKPGLIMPGQFVEWSATTPHVQTVSGFQLVASSFPNNRTPSGIMSV